MPLLGSKREGKEIKIDAEELFDLWHTQGNCVEKEWHSLENGDVETADLARRIRHLINRYLFGKNPGNPEYLCDYKHSVSLRHELFELMEKWHRKGEDELVKKSKKMVDEISKKTIETMKKINPKLQITK